VATETTLAGGTELAGVFRAHPERRYVMFGGKGGLGKTTFSAATAYWLAQQGKKVLVFSVDPQASLSDIFQQDIFGKGPVKIMDNLWAQEIDADRHIKEYQQEIRQKILDMYGLDEVPQEIEDYIQAASAEPAMEESAIFDSVVDIVNEGDYDYYIYDLVPLGHALYYLSMAKVYDEWIAKITRLREEMREYEEVAARMKRQKEVDEDQILGELQYIRNRINSASRILTDKERTAFFFVITPEQMILLDTKKAAGLFAKFDVPIGGYVVNRVIPEDLGGGTIPAYLKNRIEMQKGELDEIRRVFGSDVVGYVPELERDVTGLPMIERVAQLLYG
jgi:arsenite-transporting ATPase